MTRVEAALAGLLLVLPGAPAVAQTPLPWEAGIAHAVQAFDAIPGDRAAWLDSHAWIQRRLQGGVLRFEALRARRFGTTDLGGAADAWLDFGSRAYGEFRIDLAPDAEVVPEYAFRAEAYATPRAGWEVSAGWRRRGFRGEGVDETVVSVAEYVGRWYLRQRLTALFGAGEDGGLALELAGRRSLASPRDFLEAGLALGPAATVGGRGPAVEAADRRAAWVRLEAFPWPRIGVALRGEIAGYDEPLPDRRAVSAGILTRW